MKKYILKLIDSHILALENGVKSQELFKPRAAFPDKVEAGIKATKAKIELAKKNRELFLNSINKQK